jgi:hypothetical protein
LLALLFLFLLVRSNDGIGRERTRASGRWIAFGRTSAGRDIAVVYEMIDPITVLPVTAFDLE